MVHFPHLLAAVDWIRLLFILVFFVVPVIAKLFGGKEAADPQKRAQPRPVRRPQPAPKQRGGAQLDGGRGAGGQGAGGQGAGNQGGGRNALENEIEDFLRRSRGEAPRREPQPQVTPEPAEDIRRLVEKPTSIKQQASEAHGRESVAEHVDRHIKSHPVSEHSLELGRTVGQVDESLEGHLHEVFDHKLGSLAQDKVIRDIPEGTDAAVWQTTGSKRQQLSDAAEDRSESIVNMLRNPESIKQAIILSEILKRPDF